MVSKKYYYDIDLNGNRLLDFAVESVSGDLPSDANEGAVIYHSGEGVMYQRLKDGWKVIASGKDLEDALSKVSEDLQALSKDTEEVLKTKQDKLVAGSHISIAADGKTISSTAQVNVIETVKVNNTALEVSGKAVNIDLSDYAKKGDVTTVMRYKGSVSTFSDLSSITATLGDTYNVIDTNANYTWDGSAWDLIGSTVDLSGYATKTEVDSALGGKVSKTGDTMTGLLELDSLQFTSSYGSWRFRPSGTGFPVLSIYANNDSSKPFIQMSLSSNELRLGGDNNRVISNYPIANDDNTKVVATTAWVYTADCIVHKIGNETISGDKTFNNLLQTGNFAIYGNDSTGRLPIVFRPFGPADQKNVGLLIDNDTGYQSLYMTATKENPFIKIGSGNVKAYATTTPQDASMDEIATANWTIGKFVQKSGDTMSGSLQILTDNNKTYSIRRNNLDRAVVPTYPASGDTNIQTLITLMDKNNAALSYVQRSERSEGTILSHVINQTANGALRNHQLNQVIAKDGSMYVTAPAAYSSSDNSNKVATTAWINTADIVVHTIRDEEIDGQKRFTTPIIDPQNQSGRVSAPNSNAAATPYYKIASISMDNISAWDVATLTLDAEYGWSSTEHHAVTYRAIVRLGTNKVVEKVSLAKIWSSGQAHAVFLQKDHWFIAYNETQKVIEIWVKLEYDQGNLNYRVRMSGRRNENFANWKIHTNGSNNGAASLPSTGDGWVIVNATDTSNMMIDTLSIVKSSGNEYLVLKRNDLPVDAEIDGYWNCPKISWRDSGDNEFAYVHPTKDAVSNRIFLGAVRIVNGEKKYSELSAKISPGGIAYTSAPTPSDKTNNSTEIATTAWVNQADFLVHTTGNEDISGVKSFKSRPKIVMSDNSFLEVKNTGIALGSTGNSSSRNGVEIIDKNNIIFGQFETVHDKNLHTRSYMGAKGKNGVWKYIQLYHLADGTAYGEAPNPDTGDLERIATAGWCNGKFVGLSGDQTINGVKTFTANPVIKNNLTLVWKGPPTVENVNENITRDYVGFTTVGSFLAKAKDGGVGGTKVFRSTPNGYAAGITNLIADNASGTEVALSLVARDDGVMYAQAPSPKKFGEDGVTLVLDKSDNSTKIATTEWINQADFLVHSYGNERIDGYKSFSKSPMTTAWTGYHITLPGMTKGEKVLELNTNLYTGFFDKNDTGTNTPSNMMAGLRFTVPPGTESAPPNTFIELSNQYYRDTYLRLYDNGTTAYATCPNPPSNATTNQITTASWTLGKFIQKTGGTMTGPLTIKMELPQAYFAHTKDDYTVAFTGQTPETLKYIGFHDKNSKDTFHISEYVYNGGRGISITLSDASSGSVKSANIGLTVEKTGGTYATVPTPSSKQDNSIKVATTAWVNQSDFLVHTTGNETVAGDKTWTGNAKFKLSGSVGPLVEGYAPYFTFKDIGIEQLVSTHPYIAPRFRFVDKNEKQVSRIGVGYTLKDNVGSSTLYLTASALKSDGTSVEANLNVIARSNGTIYANAPTTPSGATGNEIATANWVNNKLAGKIHISANAPTASDGNDGDIWLQYV